VLSAAVVTGAGQTWDLTVEADHAFYLSTPAADILVHNCDAPNAAGAGEPAGSDLPKLGATPNFTNPAESPGSGWEWRGTGAPGSAKGSWSNPSSGESLHPDLGHPDPIGLHYDWKAPDSTGYRVYPDGTVLPK
jgi:hypothetical protein